MAKFRRGISHLYDRRPPPILPRSNSRSVCQHWPDSDLFFCVVAPSLFFARLSLLFFVLSWALPAVFSLSDPAPNGVSRTKANLDRYFTYLPPLAPKINRQTTWGPKHENTPVGIKEAQYDTSNQRGGVVCVNQPGYFQTCPTHLHAAFHSQF